MEFEDDEHDEEEQEEEEEDDEDEGITIPITSTAASAGPSGGSGGVKGASVAHSSRYRECQKNHAVNIGGHAVDGCGEFMPAGEEGSFDAFKCAACGCHRNFHRKETDTSSAAASPELAAASSAALYPGGPQFPHPPPPPRYYHTQHHPPPYLHHPQPRPLALPSTLGGGEMEELSNPSSSGGGSGGSGRKKRFRTKFTHEQKERMAEFAERIGWRIQKQDEAAVQQLCHDLQISRQVLKVWLHNNKHALARKP